MQIGFQTSQLDDGLYVQTFDSVIPAQQMATSNKADVDAHLTTGTVRLMMAAFHM